MLITVDPTSPIGLADQIAAQLRGQIADGAVESGERLPPARQIAAGLGVNMHTVLRAYQLLRDEGLIDLRRGRGAVVAEFDRSEVSLDGLIAEIASAAVSLGWSADRAGRTVAAAVVKLTGEGVKLIGEGAKGAPIPGAPIPGAGGAGHTSLAAPEQGEDRI